MSAALRVLLVDDSATVRQRLRQAVETIAAGEVVGEATDGREAIELCARLRPDVVTMDMMLPVMSGLAATEYIMAHCPTPILIVSASFNRGEVFKTYDALAAGAVDVFEKPNGSEADGYWDGIFARHLRAVARVKVITHPRAKLSAWMRVEPPRPIAHGSAELPVIAIGASTGGPGAVVEILRALPPRLDAALLVVMHLSPAFATEFASWLDGVVAQEVRYAVNGETLAQVAGTVRLAPPQVHLRVDNGRLTLSDAAERHSCRPSVDVLFESVAAACGARATGCLLTGMGRDGAAGLLRMRLAGAHTIAQDEASSVVFGMPREAIALGAAQEVLSLSEIGPRLSKLFPIRHSREQQ